MIDEGVSDNRLHAYVQRWLRANNMYDNEYKAIRLCGHGVLPEYKTVFVLSNGEESRFSTLIRCHSTWACPYCSPRVMADKGSDIACAIDALAKWYNQYAAMITFTLPHDKYMSCEDAYQILMLTWRMFNRGGRSVQSKKKYVLTTSVGEDKRAVGIAGEVKEYRCGYNPWSDFRVTLKMDYFVRVYEFTYGENGWHPHIHMLAWVPKENLQSMLEYEDKLLERWWHCAKHCAAKYYKQKYPDDVDFYKERIETVYADYKKDTSDSHKAVYISKNKSGKVIAQKSSHYISGWSGNMELTGSCSNAKHAQEGHLTPFQMVEISCENAAEAKRLMPLYCEYVKTTYKHRRVEFSKHPPLNPIIEKWKTTEDYIRTLKKILTDKAEIRPWKVVAWFTEKQWYEICVWDVTTDEDIRSTILELARASPDPKQAIAEYVWRFGVSMYMHEHRIQKLFEKNIYENKLLAELSA